MSLAILGIGTAVPSASLSRLDGQKIAEFICCETAEQKTFIPAIYAGSGIDRRHFCLGEPALRDVINGTNFSGSPYLPTGVPGWKGPTTRQRSQIYESEAPKLAIKASAEAFASSG